MNDPLDFDALKGDPSIFTGIFTTLKSESFQCTLSSLSSYKVANKYVVKIDTHPPSRYFEASEVESLLELREVDKAGLGLVEDRELILELRLLIVRQRFQRHREFVGGPLQ